MTSIQKINTKRSKRKHIKIIKKTRNKSNVILIVLFMFKHFYFVIQRTYSSMISKGVSSLANPSLLHTLSSISSVISSSTR